MKEFSSGVGQKCHVQLQLLYLNMSQLGWVSLEIPKLKGTKEQSKRQTLFIGESFRMFKAKEKTAAEGKKKNPRAL